MNGQVRKPVLFYSKKCPHCAEVLNKIRQGGNEFGGIFEFVCIDGNRNLPGFLKEVPTLLAPNAQTPFTGEAVFMWIDTQLRQQQRGAPSQQLQQQPLQQQKIEGAIATHMEGLSFYNPMEMSGFGDSYMSLDESTNSQEHCFVFIDNQGNKQVQCFPAGQGPNSQQQQPMTMSQQQNIRMQQNARQPPPQPNFLDVQRQPLQQGNKMNDNDFERFMAMRDQDPNIRPAPQRI